MMSCTPESSSTITISEAQPCGVRPCNASMTTLSRLIIPNAAMLMPKIVLSRSGIIEKFKAIAINNRINLATV